MAQRSSDWILDTIHGPDPDTDPDNDRYPVIKHIDGGLCCLSPSTFILFGRMIV